MSPNNDEPEDEAGLEDVAQTEHEYLHERLRQELGRNRPKKNSTSGCGNTPKVIKRLQEKGAVKITTPEWYRGLTAFSCLS